jgi:cytochrome bd-type quinol oxidase subunit 2
MRVFPAIYTSPAQRCVEINKAGWCIKYIGPEQYQIHTYENFNKSSKYIFLIVIFACILTALLNTFITKNVMENYTTTLILPAIYFIMFLLILLYSYKYIIHGKKLFVFGLILFLIVVSVSIVIIAKTPNQIYSVLSLNTQEDTSQKYILVGDVLIVLFAMFAIVKLMWIKRNVEEYSV